jgi:hypothetical protein
MVHGVGDHNHLSNLLRTYQSFRANVQSVEAPVLGEDLIPGWRLVEFDEGTNPPKLRLEPRVAPPDGGVSAVCMYEVNYSGFAGVIRRNQPIDLTGLFVGLDLAICAARQRAQERPAGAASSLDAGLATCLQRVAGIFAAGTVPIIGAPALVFRNYIGTFVALFTRFFEDIATFVLDKNGEQLISAHLDRTVETIGTAMQAGDRLVIAAHSLGSVVTHNYVVRHWTTGTGRIPDTVITFGSPIGLLVWTWLFLDFEQMRFDAPVSADRYFCWNPVSRGTGTRQLVSWMNVLNCVDPIATAFPEHLVDLSASEAELRTALKGGRLEHRYFGPARLSAVGGSHGEYLNDRQGFVEILLRACGLSSGAAEDVPSARTADAHWTATLRTLLFTQWMSYAAALLSLAAFFFLIGARVDSARTWLPAVAYLFPTLTIGVLAFFQRLLLGGPTKRITLALIRDLTWRDPVALPYRLRDRARRLLGLSHDVNPLAPSPAYVVRLLINGVSFLPALAVMLAPLLWIETRAGHSLFSAAAWSAVTSRRGFGALIAFMAYVVACAAFELIRVWRHVVRVAISPTRTN